MFARLIASIVDPSMHLLQYSTKSTSIYFHLIVVMRLIYMEDPCSSTGIRKNRSRPLLKALTDLESQPIVSTSGLEPTPYSSQNPS